MSRQKVPTGDPEPDGYDYSPMNTSAQSSETTSSGAENDVRQRIIAAAFDVLQSLGPTRLRVQEVAKRAGVSTTLLYYYFDGKNDLIAAAYAADYESILEADLALLRKMFAEPVQPPDVLASMVDAYQVSFEDTDTRRRRLDALAASQHDPTVASAIAPMQRAFTTELRSMVENLQSRGWLAGVGDVNAFMMAVMALPLGLVFRDLDPSFAVDMTSYMMTVLPSPPG